MSKAVGALMAVVAVGGPLWASSIDDARKALKDGMSQVSILKLQAQKKWANPAEQTAADILLGEALFAAGRYEDAVTKLAKLVNRDPGAKFWLAESYAALGQPAKTLPLYQDLAETSLLRRGRPTSGRPCSLRNTGNRSDFPCQKQSPGRPNTAGLLRATSILADPTKEEALEDLVLIPILRHSAAATQSLT